MPPVTSRPEPVADGAIVTKAAMRAAERLGLPNQSVARILGLSEARLQGAFLASRPIWSVGRGGGGIRERGGRFSNRPYIN